jgi:hypothetical protein
VTDMGNEPSHRPHFVNHSLMEAPTKKRQLVGLGANEVTKAKLKMLLDRIVPSRASAELAAIHLINRFKFDIDDLMASTPCFDLRRCNGFF